MPETKTTQTVEIRYQSGEVQFRYDQYRAADGQRWIRHGPFREFYANGQVATEGEFEDGLQQGLWRDYHENGQVAAEGYFVDGAEDGVWNFWNAKGKAEETIVYRDGVEIDS
jgi:antitoxin component YwqK of YwqJK toxin-antitoxin module